MQPGYEGGGRPSGAEEPKFRVTYDRSFGRGFLRPDRQLSDPLMPAPVLKAPPAVVINEAESSITVQTASGDQHVGSVASGRVTRAFELNGAAGTINSLRQRQEFVFHGFGFSRQCVKG